MTGHTQLTDRQTHDLARRLMRLRMAAAEQEKASAAALEANRRWNYARGRYARGRYAREWADIVRAYGEQNAPTWIESLRGPKPKIEGTA